MRVDRLIGVCLNCADLVVDRWFRVAHGVSDDGFTAAVAAREFNCATAELNQACS